MTPPEEAPAGDADPLVGREFAGLRIESLIGAGGMGTVYKAVQLRLQRPVAVKLLQVPSGPKRKEIRDRFEREALSAAQVSHPNVVQVHDVGEVDGVPYLVMEFVRGTSLDRVLDARGPLPERESLEVLLQCARGLEAARRCGIVHRDVKPGNVMIGEDGIAKLADFGLAKAREGMATLTQSGQLLGTPAYMAPEQMEGEGVDHRSDLYSLGVTLFEMVTGQRPFQAETPMGIIAKRLKTANPDPRSYRPDLSDGARELVLRLMATDPTERFQTAGDLAKRIETLLGVSGSDLAPGGAGEPGTGLWRSGDSVRITPAPGDEVVLEFTPTDLAAPPRSPKTEPGPPGSPTARVSRKPRWLLPGVAAAALLAAAGLLLALAGGGGEAPAAKPPAGPPGSSAPGVRKAEEDAEKARRERFEVARREEAAKREAAARADLERERTAAAAREKEAAAARERAEAEARERNEKAAAEALAVAAAHEEAGELQQALDAYVVVADRHAGTRAAGTASGRATDVRRRIEAMKEAEARRLEALAAEARRKEQAEKALATAAAERKRIEEETAQTERAIEEGLEALEDGRWAEAEAARRRIPSGMNVVKPRRIADLEGGLATARASWREARDAARRGENAAAVEALDRVLLISPRHAEAAALRERLRSLPEGLVDGGTDDAGRPLVVNARDGAVLLLVPAGRYRLGDPAGEADERPPRAVALPAFYVDQGEVTNGRYARFLEAWRASGNSHERCHPDEPRGKDHAPAHGNEKGWSAPDRPVVGVDWYDAHAYAAWAGLELPTEARWEAAAMGPESRRFPWGSDEDPGRANCAERWVHVAAVPRAEWRATMEAVGARQLPLFAASAYPSGRSPAGAADMAGSVWEWCRDAYARDAYAALRDGAEDPVRDGAGPRVLRGGSWFLPLSECRSANRFSRPPTERSRDIGFRCVRRAG